MATGDDDRAKPGAGTVRADVAVVGAGLAGAASAQCLAQAGFEVAVLEAQGRVGGRVHDIEVEPGKVIELGGQYGTPRHFGTVPNHTVLELAERHGRGAFPTYDDGERIVEFEGERVRYAGDIPRLRATTLLDFLQARWRLDRAAKRLPAVVPWHASNAAELDRQTLASWLDRVAFSRRGARLLGFAASPVFAASPSDISLLHALSYIRAVGAGSFDTLIQTAGAAQSHRLFNGPMALARSLLQEKGVSLHLNAPIRSLERSRDQIVARGEGTEVRAKRVVVAIPPPLAGRLAYSPALPARRDHLCQRMTQGSAIKVIAVYDSPWWRRLGLSGHGATDIGSVQVLYDHSPPGDGIGVLAGYAVGAAAQRLSQAQPEEQRAAALETFARFFGAAAARPEHFLVKDWVGDEWSRGGYCCFAPPGTLSTYADALCEPVDRLHWAGSETEVSAYGSMSAAIRSGWRAATEVMAAEQGAPAETQPAEQGNGLAIRS